MRANGARVLRDRRQKKDIESSNGQDREEIDWSWLELGCLGFRLD